PFRNLAPSHCTSSSQPYFCAMTKSSESQAKSATAKMTAWATPKIFLAHFGLLSLLWPNAESRVPRAAFQCLPQPVILLLQVLHSLVCGRERLLNLLCGKTRHDMLLTIPIESLDVNHIHALDRSLVLRMPNLLDPLPCRIAFQYLCAAKNLQTRLSRIIDKYQRDAAVRRQIPAADVLPVADEIRERQRLVIDHLEKTDRTSAMLNVRPS